MPERITTDWESVLSTVEASIRGCLDELEQYESRFANILAAEQATSPPRQAAEEVARRYTETHREADGWETRIAQANERTHEIEQILREQQEAWNHWRESFTEWQQSLQQPPGKQPPQ